MGGTTVNYVCVADGTVEFSTNSLDQFSYYRLLYSEQLSEANDVNFYEFTDEEFDELLPRCY
jgi:hypothetical protein